MRGERWRKRGFGSKRMVGRWRGEVERERGRDRGRGIGKEGARELERGGEGNREI